MSNEAFFRKEGDTYIATAKSRGPWSPTMLHGRVIAGLLAFQIEQNHGHADLLPARLTVDMYRPPDFSPIVIATKVVRDGHRIKVVDAEFLSGGKSMGRASCQLLRRTENSPGNVWMPPSWNAPPPESCGPDQRFGDGQEPTWRIRNISGAMGTNAQRRVWMCESRELVEGYPLTPFTRVGLISDFASPCANIGDAPLGYINTDVTVYLHRLPRSEWIGMETINHRATDGIAIGECFVYDTEGPIGSASVAALAQVMKR
jgi:Thioesterase-like superfamily